MSVYAVVFPPSYEQPTKALNEHFPDSHIELWDRTFFVSTKKTSEEIAKKLKIAAGVNRGLVVRLDYYQGTASSVVGEWMGNQ